MVRKSCGSPTKPSRFIVAYAYFSVLPQLLQAHRDWNRFVPRAGAATRERQNISNQHNSCRSTSRVSTVNGPVHIERPRLIIANPPHHNTFLNKHPHPHPPLWSNYEAICSSDPMVKFSSLRKRVKYVHSLEIYTFVFRGGND